ncbi:TraK family protein [Pseudomonas sp. NPDC087615]
MMKDQGIFVEAKKSVMRGDGRVSFVAIMEEIKHQVDSGRPLVQIYEHFEERLDLGYTQFTKYVTRYIKEGRPVFEPNRKRHQ